MTTVLIQLVLLSTRAVVSGVVWGQFGPLLSVETSNGTPPVGVALTTITIVRMRIDPATRAYVARRRAEGRTTKEIMRSLKRYITRQLFRTLAAAHPVPAT